MGLYGASTAPAEPGRVGGGTGATGSKGGWLGPRRAQARVEDVVKCVERSQSGSCRADSVLGFARRL